MRRKLLFFITMLLLSIGASAQFLEYQLGMKASVGMDWMDTYCDNFKEKNKNGVCYKFGLTGTYYFKESYGITSGFNIEAALLISIILKTNNLHITSTTHIYRFLFF